MEYPWLCCGCGLLNMVDLFNLEKRTLDNKIVIAEGFVCGKCGTWNVVIYWTQSLIETMRKLNEMDVKRRDFRYRFAKAMKKAQGVRMKAEEG